MQNWIGIPSTMTDDAVFFLMVMFALIASVGILFQVFCLVWAPFGTIACALGAYSAKRSIWRYAIAGALASIFLFVPWVHLMKDLRNKRISGTEIGDSLKVVYAFWLLWIVTHLVITLFYMFLLEDISLAPEEWSWSYFRSEYLFWSINGLILTLAIMGWTISRKVVFDNLVSEHKKAEDVRLISFPKRTKIMYILPFAATSANIIAIPVFVVLWDVMF